MTEKEKAKKQANGGQWQNEFLHNIAFIRQHLNKQEKGFFTLCDTLNYLNNTYIKSEDPTFEKYYNACGEYLINNSVEW